MALLRYTLLRAVVFAVVAALLWLAQLRGYWLVLTALFVSGIISIFVLRRSREQLSASLDRRLATIKERAEAEDAWDDARRSDSSRERQAVPRDADGSRRSDGSPERAPDVPKLRDQS